MQPLRLISKLRRFLILGILIPLLSFDQPQQSTISLEQQVKAVYLYNFAQFIDWPEPTFLNADDPIVLGILGKDPFGTFLEETVNGEVVNGHPIVVHRYSSVAQIKACHILFIHSSVSSKMGKILNDLHGRNILTVSDAPNFTKTGGMIRFVLDDNKIKLQVNLSKVKEENISISSKLLRLSEIVE